MTSAILPGVPTNDDRPMLDYAPPLRPSRATRIITALGARLLLVIALLFAGLYLPHPEGIWFLGRGQPWIIAIDSAGLTIGPYPDATSFGWVPLLALKLIVIAAPAWLARRFRARARCARTAAPG